jgi:hypothetical protein
MHIIPVGILNSFFNAGGIDKKPHIGCRQITISPLSIPYDRKPRQQHVFCLPALQNFDLGPVSVKIPGKGPDSETVLMIAVVMR